MTRLQEAIEARIDSWHYSWVSTTRIQRSGGAQLHTRKPMTSHTETTSTVTETINSMDYNTGYQYSITGSGVESTSGILSPTTGDVNVTIEGVNSKWTGVTATPSFKQTTPGAAFQFTQTVSGPGLSNHTIIQRDNRYKRNGYYKYLPAVIALLFAAPVRAEGVGGVSATASPIANSSGSVTNQAIQVLQGPYITNTYGGGIQCQGPTVNFTPFVTGSLSQQHPYEDIYMDPVFDMRDLTGDFDANGNPTGDGAPDNPGDILYHVPTRTGQKNNSNISVGFSMTWSTPLIKHYKTNAKKQQQLKLHCNNN